MTTLSKDPDEKGQSRIKDRVITGMRWDRKEKKRRGRRRRRRMGRRRRKEGFGRAWFRN